MSNGSNNMQLLNSLLRRMDLVKVMVNAISETIANYTKTPVSAGKPVFSPHLGNGELAAAGSIKLQGEEFSLVLFLGFSRELFLILYNNMFQDNITEVSEEYADLAAEILNISFGDMDPKFKKMNISLRASFPVIYVGDSLRDVLSRIGKEAIVIPFSCSGKEFSVQISTPEFLNEKWRFGKAA